MYIHVKVEEKPRYRRVSKVSVPRGGKNRFPIRDSVRFGAQDSKKKKK